METSKTNVLSTTNEKSDEIYNQINSNATKSANKTLMYFLLVMTFIILIVGAVIGSNWYLKAEQVVDSTATTLGI